MSHPHPSHGPSALCVACHGHVPIERAVPITRLRPGLADFVRATLGPEALSEGAAVCKKCLLRLRGEYVLARLEAERGELSEIERDAAKRLFDRDTVAAHIEQKFQSSATLGQRLADGVARIGGSWPFVSTFLAFLVLWMIGNTALLARGAFDPYPYILLNLVLSCLAAIQAPIIMMSQNRSAARDRMQADEDFRVNLKAELEVAALHEKMDHLLHGQWENLIEMQQAQLELLEEIAAARRAPKS